MVVDTFTAVIKVLRGDTNSFYYESIHAQEASTLYPIDYAARRSDSLSFQLANAYSSPYEHVWQELLKAADSAWLSYPPVSDHSVYTEVTLPGGFEFPQDATGNMLPPAIIASVDNYTVDISPAQVNDMYHALTVPEGITRVSLESVVATSPLLVEFTTSGDNVHIEDVSPEIIIHDPGPLTIVITASDYIVERGAEKDTARVEIYGTFDTHLMLPKKQLEEDVISVAIDDNMPVDTTTGFSSITKIKVFNVPSGSIVSIYRYFETDSRAQNREYYDTLRPAFSHTGRRKLRYWCVFDKSANVSHIASRDYFPSHTGAALGICWKNPEYAIDNLGDIDISLGWLLLDKLGNNIICDSYIVVPNHGIAIVLGNTRQTLYFFNLNTPRCPMTGTRMNGAALVDLLVDYAGGKDSVPEGIDGWVARLTGSIKTIERPILYRFRVDKPDGSSVYLSFHDGAYREIPVYGSDGWQPWDGNEVEYTVSGIGEHNITYEVTLSDGTLSRVVRVLRSLAVRAFLEIDVNAYGACGNLSCDSQQNSYISIDGDRYKIRFHRDTVVVDYENKVLYITDRFDSVMIGGIDIGG